MSPRLTYSLRASASMAEKVMVKLAPLPLTRSLPCSLSSAKFTLSTGIPARREAIPGSANPYFIDARSRPRSVFHSSSPRTFTSLAALSVEEKFLSLRGPRCSFECGHSLPCQLVDHSLSAPRPDNTRPPDEVYPLNLSEML